MSSDRDRLAANVDLGHNGGYFVRLDAALPEDARYPADGEGWFSLSPEEALSLAHQLERCARRVDELRQQRR